MSVYTQSPKLFKPITFRGLTVRNRVVASPMCQYHSVDGGPTDWQMVHVGRMAVGLCFKGGRLNAKMVGPMVDLALQGIRKEA